MEQNENVMEMMDNNFEDKWKDEGLLKILEEKSIRYSKMSWVLYYGAIIALVLGVGLPRLFLVIEDSMRYQMMFSGVMIVIGLYLLSFAFGRRAYQLSRNKMTKQLKELHMVTLILTVVVGCTFLGLAYILWIFTGFAPYPQEPFWIWLLG